jgi:hypothetical protein
MDKEGRGWWLGGEGVGRYKGWWEGREGSGGMEWVKEKGEVE